MATFGARLLAARKKRKFSVRELAGRAGVDKSWINRLENEERHNISMQAFIRLADALIVSLDWLAGRKVSGSINGMSEQKGTRPTMSAIEPPLRQAITEVLTLDTGLSAECIEHLVGTICDQFWLTAVADE